MCYWTCLDAASVTKDESEPEVESEVKPAENEENGEQDEEVRDICLLESCYSQKTVA